MTLSHSILGSMLVASTAAVFAFQGASEPVKSAPEYFVTADGDSAHLWVREGLNLRVVGHGACKDCPNESHDDHEHKEGDDHGKQKPK